MPPWEKYAGSDGPWAKYDAQSGYDKAKAGIRNTRATGSAKYGFQDQLVQNTTGLLDELSGGVEYVRQGGENLARRALGKPIEVSAADAGRAGIDVVREDQKRFAKEHPIQNTAATIGGIFTAGPVKGAASAVAKPLTTAAKAAAANLPFAVARQDGSIQERLPGAAVETALVAGTAGVGQGVANKLSRRLSSGVAPSKAAARNLPKADVEALRTAKEAAYKAVEQAGVRYKPQAVDQLVGDIAQEAAGNNLNLLRHPRAASMLSDLEELRGKPITLTQLDQVRQVIRRDVANAADNAEAFFGRKMIKSLDQFIDNAGPQHIDAGDPKLAANLVRQARSANSRFRKVEAVIDAQDAARLRAGSTGSGGNVNNATRQELRKVLDNAAGLTNEERDAFERVIIGTKGQNALRQLGKLSPSGNGLMQMFHTSMASGGATLGAMTGGPGGAVVGGALASAPAAVGIISKIAADRMTAKRVDDLLRILASGGNQQATNAAGAELSRLLSGLAQSPGTLPAVNRLRQDLSQTASGEPARP